MAVIIPLCFEQVYKNLKDAKYQLNNITKHDNCHTSKWSYLKKDKLYVASLKYWKEIKVIKIQIK